jgi:transaldolase
LASGTVGATTNPSLLLKAADGDPRWRRRARALLRGSDPEQAAARLADEMRLEAATLLLPLHEASGGEKGVICGQVDPRCHDDADAMVRAAERLAGLARNLSVKLPATAAGIEAIREATARGIGTTATVSFTCPQVRAACLAYAAGLRRLPSHLRRPRLQAVVMVGRLDDFLRDQAAATGAEVMEEDIRQAGVAVTRRCQQWLEREGIPAVILVGAARGLHHIMEFLDLSLIVTIGDGLRQEALSGESWRTGSGPSAEAIRRLESLPDFRRAYELEGMSAEEFADFGSSRRTLDEFIRAQEGLIEFVQTAGRQ